MNAVKKTCTTQSINEGGVKMMKRGIRIGLVLVMIVSMVMSLGLSACGPSTPTTPVTPKPEAYKLSMATTGATSPAQAGFVIIAGAVKELYPEIEMTLIATSGAAESFAQFLKGRAGMALAGNGDTASCYLGMLGFEGKQNQNVRIAFPMFYGNILGMPVRKDSGVTTIHELTGKPFAAQLGSSGEVMVKLFFDALGIEPNWQSTSIQGCVDAMILGNIIAISIPGGPSAGVKQVAAAIDIGYLVITEEDVAKAQAKYPGQFDSAMQDHTLYPQVDKDFRALQYHLSIVVQPDVPEEVVYKVCKAVYQYREDIAKSYSGLVYFADWPDQALTAMDVIPLHPGTIRFLRELGKTVPDKLIPPEMKK